jgi:microcystin-dependent protein
MSEPFLGEIRMVAFAYAPRGWATCDGQILPIAQNQALFSLLGTTYGGDGRVTFALPNMRQRAPLGSNSSYPLGARGGEAQHTLTTNELPAHTHQLTGSAGPRTASAPVASGALSDGDIFATGPAQVATLDARALQTVGANQPHENRQPYLAVLFVICIQGVFPSRT